MGQSYEDLLNMLADFHQEEFRSENEREVARIKNIEFVLSRTLEKLVRANQ